MKSGERRKTATSNPASTQSSTVGRKTADIETAPPNRPAVSSRQSKGTARSKAGKVGSKAQPGCPNPLPFVDD